MYMQFHENRTIFWISGLNGLRLDEVSDIIFIYIIILISDH